MQTFTSKEYLKIDVANSFGLDKLTWNERIAWFDANEHRLMALLKDADEPALFYAGMMAWQAVKRGEAVGYPISLDATSSGIQILAVLTGDKGAAELSNVLDTGIRNDAYTAMYQAMQNKVGTNIKLDRKPVKQAVMTAYYGSEKVPREVFGEGELLATFFETMQELTPGCWELNTAMLALWNPETLKYSWVLPDNFHVHVKVIGEIWERVEFLEEMHEVKRYENIPVEKGRSLGANLVHSVDGFIVRELTRRCSYDPAQIEEVRELLRTNTGSKPHVPENAEMTMKLWNLFEQSGYLSARILDYLDSHTIHLIDQSAIQTLVDSLPEKPFKLLSIHDCFRVHPNYGNDLRKQYNLQLSLIAASQMLQHLLTQIVGQPMNIRKLDQFAPEILQANYALS